MFRVLVVALALAASARDMKPHESVSNQIWASMQAAVPSTSLAYGAALTSTRETEQSCNCKTYNDNLQRISSILQFHDILVYVFLVHALSFVLQQLGGSLQGLTR